MAAMPANPAEELPRKVRHRLGLVTEVMTQQQMQRAALGTGGNQRAVAGLPRTLRQGRAMRQTGQCQHPGCDPALGEPIRGQSGFPCRAGPQPMIHDQTPHRAATPSRPLIGQKCQRQAVSPA